MLNPNGECVKSHIWGAGEIEPGDHESIALSGVLINEGYKNTKLENATRETLGSNESNSFFN